MRKVLPVSRVVLDTLPMTSPAVPTARAPVDTLDCRILLLLLTEPGIGVLGASRRLGVARGTVQARLDRLQRTGVLRSMAPDVDPAALGYPVTAFCTLEIRQGRRVDVRGHRAQDAGALQTVESGLDLSLIHI